MGRAEFFNREGLTRRPGTWNMCIMRQLPRTALRYLDHRVTLLPWRNQPVVNPRYGGALAVCMSARRPDARFLLVWLQLYDMIVPFFFFFVYGSRGNIVGF